MKFNKNILAKSLSLVVLMAFFYSCNHDEFLDKTNPNAITLDGYLNSETQFNSGLTTVYAALQFHSQFGAGLCREMAKGDLVGGDDWNRNTLAYSTMSYTDNDSYIVQKWQDSYVGIFRANQIVDNLSAFDGSDFTGQTKEQIIAQARFLRAYFYFELVHTYGEAIINLSSTDLEFQRETSSMSDVVNTVIIPDLVYAKANLPKSWDSVEDIGRVTWGAATALLGKTYLYDKQWPLASTQFQEVIDEGIYSLVANPADNFREDITHNSESIFEVAFDESYNESSPSGLVDDSWNTGVESTDLTKSIAPQISGGWAQCLPTYPMVEMFHRQEVDPTAAINSGGNTLSKRMAATIITRVDDNRDLFYGQTMAELNAQAPFLNRHHAGYVAKHTNWQTKTSEPTQARSSLNFTIIRYADVLLMHAEALVNQANVPDAITYIDLVRSRAGVRTLQDYITATGNFPAFHISEQVNGFVINVSPTAQNILTHIQRVERVLEFAFEGTRWKDLVRWGIASTVFTEGYADEVWRQANESTIVGSTIPPLYLNSGNGSVRTDFLGPYNSYVLGANSSALDYYPIPATEIQANPSAGATN